MDVGEFTIEAVEPHLGTTFRVARAEGDSVELRFERVAPLMKDADPKRLKRRPFSMLFVGPREAFLPQMTYVLSHETLGEHLDIFLVPIEQNASGYLYEAVFT